MVRPPEGLPGMPLLEGVKRMRRRRCWEMQKEGKGWSKRRDEEVKDFDWEP